MREEAMREEAIAAALAALGLEPSLEAVAPELYLATVPGPRALAIWEALAAQAEALEAWPMVLVPGPRDLLEELRDWPEWNERACAYEL